jgi:hypothetical protein
MFTSIFKWRYLRERVLRAADPGGLYQRRVTLGAGQNELQSPPLSSDGTKWAFIHIPKTGGTSVIETLRRQAPKAVGNASIYELIGFPDTFDDAVILSGHIPYFMFQWETSSRRLATVLRDPVARVLSFYRYVLATPQHPAHVLIQRDRLALAECYEHPVLRIEISDYQTRMLGWAMRKKVIRSKHGPRECRTMWSEYIDSVFGPIGLNTLATAQSRLLTDVHFACLERPATVLALCRRMAGQSVPAFQFENQTPAVPWAPNERDLEMVAAHNALDRALYDFALTLLDKAHASTPS